jgi:diacylglycerol kinase (ATP)
MLPQLEAALPTMSWELSTTEEGLSHLAEQAVRAGHRHIVGVGGDGTHHEIVNGLVAAGLPDDLVYLPLPSGSGNDWVRTLRVPRKLEQWLAMLPQATTINHAVGRLEFCSTPSDETPDSEKYFINVAGMAYDAEVVRRAEKSPLKRRLLYPMLTLAFLGDYSAPTVQIQWDGGQRTCPVHTINLGLGRYSGGGMSLVPHADPTRGDFALTFAERLPIWKILVHSWRFYTDTIGKVPEVTTVHTNSITVTPTEGQLELEADGEWLGYGLVRAEILPQKLRVVVPKK